VRIITSIIKSLILSVGLFSLITAQAVDYYVSTTGNDSNAGSLSQPFKTITYAYSRASAGTIIHVLPGTYYDYQIGWGIHLGKSGTASSPIILKSEQNGKAIIDGKNASDRNQGFYIDGDYNVVDGFEITGGPHGGISIWSNGNKIINNNIHHNGTPASTSTLGQDGIYSSETTSDNYYANNFIHDNGRIGSNFDHGLYLCGNNETIINNILFRNAAYGLHIAGYDTVNSMRIYNNVISYNGKSGIILWMAVSGVDIKNNIIYNNAKYGIDSFDAHGSGVVVDKNIVFGNPLGNYNFTRDGSDYSYTLGITISSDPRFVDNSSATFNPHLSSTSPAIKSGLNLSSIFTTDFDGIGRPSGILPWDIGVYNYGSGISTSPLPPTNIRLL